MPCRLQPRFGAVAAAGAHPSSWCIGLLCQLSQATASCSTSCALGQPVQLQSATVLPTMLAQQATLLAVPAPLNHHQPHSYILLSPWGICDCADPFSLRFCICLPVHPIRVLLAASALQAGLQAARCRWSATTTCSSPQQQQSPRHL